MRKTPPWGFCASTAEGQHTDGSSAFGYQLSHGAQRQRSPGRLNGGRDDRVVKERAGTQRACSVADDVYPCPVKLLAGDIARSGELGAGSKAACGSESRTGGSRGNRERELESQ